MESEKSWVQKALVSELIQGLEIARKLKEDFNIPSSIHTRDSLLQSILSSYNKALLILRPNAPFSNSETMHQPTQTSSPHEGALKDHQELKQNAKKRKKMPKWKEQVRVKIHNGVEEPLQDDYSWRKYGQKNILNAKYPRSYYRCTFQKSKGCFATKQVQRSEEDPNVFDISYRGNHVCSQGKDVVLSLKLADTEEKSQGCDSDIQFHHAQSSRERVTNYTNTLIAETDNMTQHPFPSFECMTHDNHHTFLPSFVLENDPFCSTISQTSFFSPNSPESNYLVSPSFHLHDEFDRVFDKPCPDSDAVGIVLADAPTTNSPIFDFNFSLDTAGIGGDCPSMPWGFHPKCP
ncbi:probable WRKY transcription factor 53 [Vigna radiata var. radiata]|uniref:Probable WRKY transcription factor 53 n=1 Tax=Vigna radiata var. radiata TaxID=3916 RepID=A0A1S3VR07_VIGRR|nr:probable WRKY transcription factor 53 [Vigna radiata var. radiata]